MKQTKSVFKHVLAGGVVLVALGVFSARFIYKPDNASAHSALGSMVLDASTTKEEASVSADGDVAEKMDIPSGAEQADQAEGADLVRDDNGKDSDAGDLQAQTESDNQNNNADASDNGSGAASMQNDANDEHDGGQEINATSSEENASQNNLLDIQSTGEH